MTLNGPCLRCSKPAGLSDENQHCVHCGIYLGDAKPAHEVAISELNKATDPDRLHSLCRSIELIKLPHRGWVGRLQLALSDALERVQGTWKGHLHGIKIAFAEEFGPECVARSHYQCGLICQLLTDATTASTVNALVAVLPKCGIYPVDAHHIETALFDAQGNILHELATTVNSASQALGYQWDKLPETPDDF